MVHGYLSDMPDPIYSAAARNSSVQPIPGELSIEQMTQRVAELAIANAVVCSFKGVQFSVPQGILAKDVLPIYKAREFDVWATRYNDLFVTLNIDFYTKFGTALNGLATDRPKTVARVLDIGCGEGFIARALYADPLQVKADPDPRRLGAKTALTSHRSQYVGIDPSAKSIEVLNQWFDTNGASPSTVQQTLIAKSGEVLLDPSVRADLIDRIGGRATLMTMGASLHVMAKSLRVANISVADYLKACAELCEPGALFVLGNYYHLADDVDGQEGSVETRSDFDSFAQTYKHAFAAQWKKITGSDPVTHEPTPPDQLFPPAVMAKLLEDAGFTVRASLRVQSNPALGVDGHPGLRAYIMSAERKH